MIPSVFELDFTYCGPKEVSFNNRFDDVDDAMQQYCALLTRAVMQDERPPARHITQITMTVWDERGQVITRIETPRFSCEHSG